MIKNISTKRTVTTAIDSSTKIKLVLLLSLTALLLLAMLTSAVAFAQQTTLKIGFVRSDRVIAESTAAQEIRKKLEAEFTAREAELKTISKKLAGIVEKLERDSSVMSASEADKLKREASELDRDFKRKQQSFREDQTARGNEELSKLVEKANKIIKQIAETEKYDLVLQDAVYVSPKVDLTDKVIKALNK